MSRFYPTLFGLALACVIGSGAAHADVKAGVDAWAQGDYARAIAQWQPLAQSGDADALFNMGQAYKLGRGVPVDLDRALDYYRQAAAQNHVQAEDNYGLILFQQNRRAEAMPYIKRSAERGEARAQYIYGIALFNGDLIGKDWPVAYAMMTRAANAGIAQASSSLAQMNQHLSAEDRARGLALSREPLIPSVLMAEADASTQKPIAPRKEKLSTPAPAPAVSGAATPSSKPTQKPVKVAKANPAPVSTISPTPKTVMSGNWRVQLGAFSNAKGADRMWKQLVGKVSGLSGYQRFTEKAGSVTRLQAGPFPTSNAAATLCGRIRSAGGDCLPVRR